LLKKKNEGVRSRGKRGHREKEHGRTRATLWGEWGPVDKTNQNEKNREKEKRKGQRGVCPTVIKMDWERGLEQRKTAKKGNGGTK